jgi:hypothetical protein
MVKVVGVMTAAAAAAAATRVCVEMDLLKHRLATTLFTCGTRTQVNSLWFVASAAASLKLVRVCMHTANSLLNF